MSVTQIVSDNSSSGKWVPESMFTPPLTESHGYNTQSTDSAPTITQQIVARNMRLISVPKRIYPRWLNMSSWVALLLVPVGLAVFLVSRADLLGLFFMGLGFFGIWVLGSLAPNLERIQYQTMISRNGR